MGPGTPSELHLATCNPVRRKLAGPFMLGRSATNVLPGIGRWKNMVVERVSILRSLEQKLKDIHSFNIGDSEWKSLRSEMSHFHFVCLRRWIKREIRYVVSVTKIVPHVGFLKYKYKNSILPYLLTLRLTYPQETRQSRVLK